jgi:hypothetical protein
LVLNCESSNGYVEVLNYKSSNGHVEVLEYSGLVEKELNMTPERGKVKILKL